MTGLLGADGKPIDFGSYFNPKQDEEFNIGYPTTNNANKINAFNNDEDMFGVNADTLSNIGTGAVGLANAFLAYKQYELANDAFKENKKMNRKSYNMSVGNYNQDRKRANSYDRAQGANTSVGSGFLKPIGG